MEVTVILCIRFSSIRRNYIWVSSDLLVNLWFSISHLVWNILRSTLHDGFVSCSIQLNHLMKVMSHLSLFPVAPTLEHRASLKRFVSLQFLNPKTFGSTLWMGDKSVARPLRIQTQNEHTQIFMPWAGFEPTIPAFERAKIFHVLGRMATVIGIMRHAEGNISDKPI
jgi:hypothetical protein